MKEVKLLAAILVVVAVFGVPARGAGLTSAQTSSSPNAMGVLVQVVSPPANAVPGDLVTHVFRIENPSLEPTQVTLVVDLPSGWFDLGFPTQLALSPQSSQDLFLTVIVPHQAYGDHLVRLVAVAGETTSEAEIGLHVRGVLAVDVWGPGDERTFSGSRITRLFTVANAGNAPDTYVLSGESRRGWPVSVAPQEVTLMPGERAAVEMHVAIPKDARGTDVSTFTAVSKTDPRVSDEEEANLRILGALAEPEPLVAVLQARSVASYDPKANAGRVNLSAGGELDPERRDGRTISLNMGVPFPRSLGDSKPFLSSLVYERPGGRLALGEVAAKDGILARIDGYGVDWSTNDREISWGVAAVDGDRYALRASLDRGRSRVYGFLKADSAGGSGGVGEGEQALLVAAGGRVSGLLPWAEWALEAETGGRLDRALDASGVRFKGDAIAGRQRLSLIVESWEPGLLGAEGVSRLSFAWLTYADWLGNLGLYAGLAVPGGRFQGEERSFEERLYLGRSLGPGLFAYAQQHARARMGSGATDDNELGVLTGVRLAPFEQLPQANLTLQLSSARQRRSASGLTVQLAGAQVGANLPIGTATLTAQAEYKRAEGEGGAEGRSAGLIVNLRTPAGPRDVVDLRWRFEWDLLSRESAITQSAKFSHQLAESVAVTAKAERSQGMGWESWSFALEGAVDFHLPTPIPIKGAVKGRLIPLDPGINVDRVILRTGELRTLSGPDGTFAFPALAPGAHVIQIEGLPARVLTVPDEIVVEVRPGKTSEIEVGLQSAAGIDAKLVWGEPAGYSLPGRRPSLEGVRVALYEGERLVAEARTRDDGTLQFADLAPGSYRLALDLTSLPPGVTALQTETPVTVAEREWRTVEWTLQEPPPVIFFDPIKPSAAFAYAPEAPRAGDRIVFRERATVDMQRRVVSWSWDFGDGHTAEGPEVIHIFERPGRYRVTLTVVDSAGDSDTASRVLVVE